MVTGKDDCDGDGAPNIRDIDECEVFIPEVCYRHLY